MSSDAEQIRVEILATAAQFRTEMDTAIRKVAGPGGLKDAIKDVPNEVSVDVLVETGLAHARLTVLEDEAKKAKKVIEDPASMDVDIAKAMLKLETLKAKAEQVERDLSRPSPSSRLKRGLTEGIEGAGFGGSGSSGGVFLGGTGPVGALGAAAAAGSPAILAGLGGLGGILGSAGAGILGAGAVGTSGLGILTVGLGSIVPVAKQAVEGISNVTKAQEALDQAQAKYGASSKQALQAQQNLTVAIREAGPAAGTIAKQLDHLADSWTGLSAPARGEFMKILTEGLQTIQHLLPTIAQIAKSSLDAIDAGLQPVFKGLASPEFKAALGTLAGAFAQLAPPLIEGFANIFHALMNVAIAGAPFVIQLADGFAELTAGWVSSTSHGSELSHIIGGLFSQFKSWWELTKALGGMLVSLFSAGASSGQGLVNTLTGILREWTRWMNTAAGQAALKGFFRDCAGLVRELFAALAPLVAAVFQLISSLMPVFTRALQVLAPVISVIAAGIKLVAGAMGDGRIAGNLLAAALVAVAVGFAAIKIGAFLGPIMAAVTEVGGLSAALKILWATMLENPIGLLLGGLALVAGAIFGFTAGQGRAKTSAEDLTRAIKEQRDALSQLRDMALETEQVDVAKKAAATNLAVAERQLANDRKSAHPDRLQIAQDERGVEQARLDLKRATKEAEAQTAKNAETEATAAAKTQAAEKTYHDRGTTLEANIRALKDSISAQEHNGRAMQHSAEYTQALTEKKERLAAEERKLTNNQKNESKSLQEAGAAAEGSIPAFDHLHGKIVSLWTDGAAKTKQGLEEINKLTRAELKILAPAATGEVAKMASGLAKGLEGFAVGGYIGQPGERGHDEIPIVVGRGEAILHAGHQEIVNAALAYSGIAPGGLEQVFSQTGGLHYNFAGGGFAGGGTGRLGAMVSTANRIASQHYNYEWGGGHDGAFSPAHGSGHGSGPGVGYDCSGAVSAVLHAGGLLPTPEVASQFMTYGTPGPGPVTIYASPDHVYMSLDGRYFGTSASNPGGGAGWFAGGPRPGFTVRHVDPTGSPGEIGSIIGNVKVQGVSGAVGAIAQASVNQARRAANTTLSSLGGNVPGAAAGQVGGGNANTAAAGGKYNRPALEGLWDRYGGAPSAAHVAGAVALAESGGNPASENRNTNGTIDRGLWQINSVHGAQSTFDIAGNTKAAISISADGSNWGPWTTYKTGAYRQFMATGGFAGGRRAFARGGFAGGLRSVGRSASRRASKPPAPKKTHSISSSTWTSMPKDVLEAAKTTRGLADKATAADTGYQHLLDTQALTPTEALVTLTEADVAAMDPKGELGYQAGDQLPNQHGMTVGRYYGPTGITGGAFVAGIDTRTGQISELLSQLGSEAGYLEDEQSLDGSTRAREQKAVEQKRERRERIRAFLAKSVKHAQAVKKQLEDITTGDLRKNLAKALSREAITNRTNDLRGQQRTLQSELAAERHHQSQLIPIEKDSSYTESLQAQLSEVGGAIATETRLSSTASAKGAVAKAREALLKDSLKRQLKGLEKENTKLGGKADEIGTGGLWGTVNKQISALAADEPGWQTDASNAASTLYGVHKTIGELTREQTSLGGVVPIQVRQPGQSSEQLLALVKEQLGVTQQALALSQAQFAVFSGFAPLAQGRLVGTFATGIDRVPRTGPAIVHQGEVILPDPDGPYGNRAAAQVRAAQGGGGGPIELLIGFDEQTGLHKIIDARMNRKALRVVSDHGGQRARLIAGVTTSR